MLPRLLLGIFPGLIRNSSSDSFQCSFGISPGIPPGIHPEFLPGFIMEFLQRFIHPFPTLIHPGFIQDSSPNSPGLHLEFLSEFTGDSSRHSPGIPSWIHPEFLPEFTRSSSQGSPGIPPLIHPKFRFSISEIPSGISRGIHLGFFKGTTRDSPGISPMDSSGSPFGIYS